MACDEGWSGLFSTAFRQSSNGMVLVDARRRQVAPGSRCNGAPASSGRSGPEIAYELHIAHDTVRTHVRNAMTKLGARSRAHLVAKALSDGAILE